MEITEEKSEVLGKLNDEEKSKLISDIVGKFQQWDDARSDQIATAQKIMEEVYLNQPDKKYDGELAWKTDIKTNALYNIKRTKTAALWQQVYSDNEQMFDVKGTNEQTEQNAKIQKASIVRALDLMNVQRQYDKVVNDLFDIGEMIFKTDWERRSKVVKRQATNETGWELQNIVRSQEGAGFEATNVMADTAIPYYENARVEEVSPFMFVFDASKFKQGDKRSWDSLWKIYKKFDTFTNIKNNKIYDITPEIISDLENSIKNDSADVKQNEELRKLDEYGGQLAILYCHGDFKIGKKLYKNYIAEVLAGKYLIRFEENPLYINPFIFCALEYDPKTKRGISPLKCALSFAKEQENITNKAFDVQKLKADPPSFANEDLFDEDNTEDDGTVKLSPGKIIKVKNDYSGTYPTPVNVSGEGISDLLNLTDQKISDLTSVSNFMYGNVTDTKRTATELSLVDKGASAQVSKELDIINQDLTIPMIENVAELLAMFKNGVDYVYTKEQGKNVEYQITNTIRQAQYEYIYEDRNAIENRKAKFEQAFQLMSSASVNPQLFAMFNWKEIYTTAFEMLGFDNPDKFFKDETPVEVFADQLRQIPSELQEQAVGELSQHFMGMVQNYQQQQEQAQIQEQAEKQVQMQAMREQARNSLQDAQLEAALRGV